MEKLIIKATQNTPFISFDPQSGQLEITGDSLADNIGTFFNSLLAWVDEYGKKPAPKTHLLIYFHYFNNETSKSLIVLLKRLERIYDAGAQVKVSWFYKPDDRDIMEAGEYFQHMVTLPISLINVETSEGV